MNCDEWECPHCHRINKMPQCCMDYPYNIYKEKCTTCGKDVWTATFTTICVEAYRREEDAREEVDFAFNQEYS